VSIALLPAVAGSSGSVSGVINETHKASINLLVSDQCFDSFGISSPGVLFSLILVKFIESVIIIDDF
jgi:hypothetical protein